MIERFKADQSASPAYFYCTRSAAEPERSDPNAVLASILRQLSCVEPGAPILSPVIEKYKRQGEGFKSNGLDLDDSRDLIIRLIEDYSMTIIIVDALDECDPLRRESLLDAFEHILKESVGLVKILVSSRNDQDIVYTLRQYPNMEISSDKNTADIKTYVETETMRLVKTGQLLRNSRAKEKMTASIIEQVSGGADGMFRWASLPLDVLRALKRDEDIQTRLGRLPPKLEQLYLDVYNNLISAQGEIGCSIIDNALKWLLCTQTEFCAADFLTAVAANLNISDGEISVDSLLELCNNFVVYDEGLDVFRFAHLSVREFLEQLPEFTKVPCYSLAAECCLLQIVASSNCPNTQDLVTDAHLLRLRGSPTDAEASLSARFLEHANNLWMKYCQAIPLNDRSQDTNFGQIFRFFLSDKLGSSAPLKVWVQWYCSRVLITDSTASLKLQDLLTIYTDSLSRSFFVATFSGFSEIVTSCLRDRVLRDEMKDQGLLLAAMATQQEIFDIISKQRENWAMTEPLLHHAVSGLDKERLDWLLDKAPDTMISRRTVAAVAEDCDDGKMAMFFNRYPDLPITNETLEDAIGNASLDNFGRLVARAVKPVITQHMLLIPHYPRPKTSKPLAAYTEKISILLNRMGGSDLTPDLMANAVSYSDEHIVEAMLKKGCIINENLMVDAVQRGREMLQLMLQYGGNITDAVLDKATSKCDEQVWQMLLEEGYASSINAKWLKLAALNYHHDDASLRILLDYADLTALANEMAGLIQKVARMGRNGPIRQLLNRAKDVTISQDMLLAATLNRSFDRLGRVQMFLKRSSELQITEDMLVIAASDGYQGVELMQVFLERGGEPHISEYVLMAAACNKLQGYQIMRLLAQQDNVVVVTEDVLFCAAQHSSPDLVLNILERSEAKIVMGRLLEAAAMNEFHDGDLMKLLLARAKVTQFPEDVFIAATGNEGNGIKVITGLEAKFGRTDVTENLMLKCIHRATKDTIKLLLSRIDPGKITKETLIRAMGDFSNGFRSDHVRRCVAEKCPHFPITTEILAPTAQHGTVNLFRFLWNRCRRSSVPEDLINAAAKNHKSLNGQTTFSFLLHEVDCVEIGEATLIAIAANRSGGCVFFDLLLEQGLKADTTEGVPKTLLMNGGIKTKCSRVRPLQLSSGTKVTETMFKIAASHGDERFLRKLSNFCELESTPEKWLHIAQLFNAANISETDNLETLLASGVEPNIAGPDGVTPLTAAFWGRNEETVQMLLSAGASPDGGPGLKNSPLCTAVYCGEYDMVEILVNAGASLDFRDNHGQTPSMIAKSRGHILIFKYLEQSRMQQERERGGPQTPEVT